MAESRGPAEARYQLPEGTYRELIVKDRMTKFLKERHLTRVRKLIELRVARYLHLPRQHHNRPAGGYLLVGELGSLYLRLLVSMLSPRHFGVIRG